MKYKLIQAPSPAELETAVQPYLNQGWVLQGGVACAAGLFAQALTHD